tara:strand:- start:398 stop:1921 length:1524 start_codon:yes stop_codon:yes gene_type:complete
MKIILSLTPSELWKTLQLTIEARHAASPNEINSGKDEIVVLTPYQSLIGEDIIALLKRSEKLIIFCQQAEYWLSESIANGVQVSEALQLWKKLTIAVLDLKKKNRSKVKIINLNLFVLQSQRELLLSNIIGCDINLTSQLDRALDNNFHLILAKQAVYQSTLTSLNDIFDASCEMMGENIESCFDVQSLLDEQTIVLSDIRYHEGQSKLLEKELVTAHEIIDDLNKKIENLNNELSESSSSKQELQREYENKILQSNSIYKILEHEKNEILASYQDNYDISKRLSEINAENKVLIQKTHSFRLKNRKAHAEIELLRESLDEKSLYTRNLTNKYEAHRYQSEINHKKLLKELNKTRAELGQYKAKNAEYHQKVQNLELEVKTIKDSVLWRSSAPIRAISNRLTKPERIKQSFQRDLSLIMESQYFDADWYIETYPDIAEAKLKPAEHYLKFGLKEKRYCSPIFDPIWYLDKYPDVVESGMNPLLHFIKYGELEGRLASPKLLEFTAKK